MAVPVYESIAITNSTVSQNSEVVTKPTGTVSGDHLMLVIQARNSAANADYTITPPTDFVLVEEQVFLTRVKLSVYHKIAGESEPSDYTINFSANTNRRIIALVRTSGVDSTTPINDSSVGTGTSSTLTTPSVTTTVDDCLVYRIGSANGTSITTSGVTERWNESQTERNAGGDVSAASAGSTGTVDWTLGFSATWAAITVALAPTGGAASYFLLFPEKIRQGIWRF